LKAWRVHELGEPEDVMTFDDLDEPVAGPEQLLVQVDAVALNFPDLLLCRGLYQEKPPLPFTASGSSLRPDSPMAASQSASWSRPRGRCTSRLTCRR
jgi:hypothetical protein